MYPAVATSEQHTCGAMGCSFQLKCTVQMWDLELHPGDSQCKFRTDDSICGTGSGEIMAFLLRIQRNTTV